MAEHPLERTQPQRLPYIDPSILEDRTRPPKPVPMWLGRPFGSRARESGSQLRVRARHLIRTLTRTRTRD